MPKRKTKKPAEMFDKPQRTIEQVPELHPECPYTREQACFLNRHTLFYWSAANYQRRLDEARARSLRYNELKRIEKQRKKQQALPPKKRLSMTPQAVCMREWYWKRGGRERKLVNLRPSSPISAAGATEEEVQAYRAHCEGRAPPPPTDRLTPVLEEYFAELERTKHLAKTYDRLMLMKLPESEAGLA